MILDKALLAARKDVARVLALAGEIDESLWLPALRRYTGYCYQTGAVRLAVDSGAHVLIISGGYGAVLATETIGWYDRSLDLREWQPHLIERCLQQYARRHRLRVAVAFVSRTTKYAKVIRSWAGRGVDRAYLVFPDTSEQRTSQRFVTNAYGEALAAFVRDELRPGWSSEADVRVRIEQIK